MRLRRTKLILVFVTALFPPLAQAASSQNWLPDRGTIDEIEAAIAMPDGARPIADYRRFYTGDRKDGRPVVRGTFVLQGLWDHLLQRPAAAPINIVEKADMPIILDGGCAVVNLEFDTQRKQIVSISCNGHA